MQLGRRTSRAGIDEVGPSGVALAVGNRTSISTRTRQIGGYGQEHRRMASGVLAVELSCTRMGDAVMSQLAQEGELVRPESSSHATEARRELVAAPFVQPAVRDRGMAVDCMLHRLALVKRCSRHVMPACQPAEEAHLEAGA
jgi:predicted GNAT family acetyltransferase